MWRRMISTWALWRGPGSQLSSGARPACGQVRGSWRLSQAVHPGDTFEEGVGSLWSSYCRGFRRGNPAREVTVLVPQHPAWHTCLCHSPIHTTNPSPARPWRRAERNPPVSLGGSDWPDPRLRITDTLETRGHPELWLHTHGLGSGCGLHHVIMDQAMAQTSIFLPNTSKSQENPPFSKHVFNETQWGKVQGSRDL